MAVARVEMKMVYEVLEKAYDHSKEELIYWITEHAFSKYA